MHLRNKTILVVLICILLAGSFFSWAQTRQSQASQSSAQNVQPSPLPSDIDPNDPALPVWMRPANAPPAPKASTTAASGAAANVPPNQPQQTGSTGQVTKG